MGKLIYENEAEGYVYISDKGIKYSLYKLITLGGKANSDICFIMNDQYPEINREICESEKTYGLGYEAVGYFYGAIFIGNVAYQNEYIKEIERLIDRYEKENPEIIELILKLFSRDCEANLKMII